MRKQFPLRHLVTRNKSSYVYIVVRTSVFKHLCVLYDSPEHFSSKINFVIGLLSLMVTYE